MKAASWRQGSVVMCVEKLRQSVVLVDDVTTSGGTITDASEVIPVQWSMWRVRVRCPNMGSGGQQP